MRGPVNFIEAFHGAARFLGNVRFRKLEDADVEWCYAEDELYVLRFPNHTYAFVRGRSPGLAWENYQAGKDLL